MSDGFRYQIANDGLIALQLRSSNRRDIDNFVNTLMHYAQKMMGDTNPRPARQLMDIRKIGIPSAYALQRLQNLMGMVPPEAEKYTRSAIVVDSPLIKSMINSINLNGVGEFRVFTDPNEALVWLRS